MYLIDLISDLGLLLQSLNLFKLKEHGEYYTCSCPSGLHYDKNPSMAIYKSTGYFVCFACGYKGFLNKLIKDLTGQEAEDYLNINGIANHVFRETMKKKEKPILNIDDLERDLVMTTNGELIDVKDSSRAMRYVRQRKIPDELIKEWNIQFAYYAELNGTVFRDRLCIPVFNSKGTLISYEGRDVTGEQKPKVLYPKGGKVSTLFRWSHLDKTKPIYAVEGIMDAIAIWRQVTKNVTCTFGINITQNQKILLTQIPKLVMVPDSDDSGQRMLDQIESFYPHDYEIVRLPKGCDPGDCTKEQLIKACTYRESATKELSKEFYREYRTDEEKATCDDTTWTSSLRQSKHNRTRVY